MPPGRGDSSIAAAIVSIYMERVHIGGTPDPYEAAAIAAALARFDAETAPVAVAAGNAVGPWQRAALVEGVGTKAIVQKHLEGGAQWLS